MDKTLIDNIEFEYDSKDYPDFSDAMIISADYDGKEMTEDKLNEINDDSDFVHEKLFNYLY